MRYKLNKEKNIKIWIDKISYCRVCNAYDKTKDVFDRLKNR